MFAISNAFFFQAEVVQADRWSKGPLEIVFVNLPGSVPLSDDRLKTLLALHEWNQTYAAGYIRRGETLEAVAAKIPGLEHRQNPNIIFAPCTPNGVSELHVMLASLLPDAALREEGLERSRANMALALTSRSRLSDTYASAVEKAFAKYIWSKIAPCRRDNVAFFSERSPLRLLAGDARFWMQRIYRIALDRRENWFEPTTDEEETWKPMDELEAKFFTNIPVEDKALYRIRRPLMGGTIWDEKDHEEREVVLSDALTGAGVMDSVEPVIDLLRTQRAHEDFSSRLSWVKEDFERSFYSKRAKLKVELVETIDDAPVWDSDDCDGYGQVLFRDIMAILDVRERKLLLALRHGKTPCEIAKDSGLRGHAAISRRVKKLKAKVAKLLQ